MTLLNLNWDDKTTVKKGNIGEQLVNTYLVGRGFVPYSPDVGGVHPFDRLVASRDKKTIFIADIKTKARRKFYPDTGIDVRHYNEYKYIQDKYAINVFIFFVDEESKCVYGNILRELDMPKNIFHNGRELEYPMMQGSIRYFHIDSMKQIAKIPSDIAIELQKLTTKKECFKPT